MIGERVEAAFWMLLCGSIAGVLIGRVVDGSTDTVIVVLAVINLLCGVAWSVRLGLLR